MIVMNNVNRFSRYSDLQTAVVFVLFVLRTFEEPGDIRSVFLTQISQSIISN